MSPAYARAVCSLRPRSSRTCCKNPSRASSNPADPGTRPSSQDWWPARARLAGHLRNRQPDSFDSRRPRNSRIPIAATTSPLRRPDERTRASISIVPRIGRLSRTWRSRTPRTTLSDAPPMVGSPPIQPGMSSSTSRDEHTRMASWSRMSRWHPRDDAESTGPGTAATGRLSELASRAVDAVPE